MGAKRVVAAAALAALVAVWSVGAAVRPAAAAPEISIRAHTQIQFDGIRRSPDGTYIVRGRLTDKLTGDGLEHQQVRVTVGTETRTVFTEPAGWFNAVFTGLVGPQEVAVELPATPVLDGADGTYHGVEVDKQALGITVTATPLPDGSVEVIIFSFIEGQIVPVQVSVFAGPIDAEPSTLPKVGEMGNEEKLVLPRDKAGGPGRHRLRVEFAGNATYASTRAETTYEIKTATKTTFALGSTTVAYEDAISGRGKVVDAEGKPVAKAAVTLIAAADSRRLEQTATRADGSYRFRIEAKLLGEGPHNLQVAADPPSAYLSGSTTEPIRVVVKAPQPVPIAFTAAAFAATALVAGGFFLARSRPWDRKRRQPPPAERPAGPADERGEVKGGLTQARPGIVSTLRRASDVGLTGTVRDAVRGRALAGAVIRLRLGPAPAPIDERKDLAGDDGGFAFEDLAAGDWTAKVSAPGHVAERFAVTIPHRGELRGVRVDLVPVREAVFALYRTAAEPLLPEARLWGVWSPRQIVDHVRRQRPTPALAQLTDFVEEAYFSARVPDEDVLPAARDHVDRAVRERAGRNAPPAAV